MDLVCLFLFLLQMQLAPRRLSELHSDLKIQEKDEFQWKKLKAEGLDEDGEREAKLRRNFNSKTTQSWSFSGGVFSFFSPEVETIHGFEIAGGPRRTNEELKLSVVRSDEEIRLSGSQKLLQASQAEMTELCD